LKRLNGWILFKHFGYGRLKRLKVYPERQRAEGRGQKGKK